MAAAVMDASALLAYLQAEAGEREVSEAIDGALMSTVNYCEVHQRLSLENESSAELLPLLQALGLEVVPFTVQDAEIASSLWRSSRNLGLSLADRACLALGIRHELPILTADRSWLKIRDLDAQVRVIRP